MTVKAIRSSHLWVKATPERLDRASAHFVIPIYNEAKCAKCPYLQDRHSDICEDCDSFSGRFKLFREREIKGQDMLGLPVGDVKRVKKVLGSKITVKRTTGEGFHQRFRSKLKFTAELWPNQKAPVEEIKRHKRGVLLSPPRSGKTVMAIKVACDLGYKTLILASQVDWLKQFLGTIEGRYEHDGTELEKPVTNINDLREQYPKRGPIAKLCNTVEDMMKCDIALVTYQTFLSKSGKRKLRQIRNMFGLVLIDECHDTSADGYLSVVADLNPVYMFGLTGTYDRKDGRVVLSKIVLGGIKARGKGDTEVPTVRFIETGVHHSGKPHATWPGAVNWLSTNVDRNAAIVKHALADIKAGHSVVIPVDRVDHAKLLATMINKAYQRRTGKSTNIAADFTGQLHKGNKSVESKRDRVRLDAIAGRLRCIVGIRKLVQVGLNVPRWSMLYNVIPISNPPKYEQETSRIRTKMAGKPPIMIKHFLEDFGITRGCLRTCYWQTYKPLGFKMDAKDAAVAAKYMRKGPLTSSKTGKW